MKKNRSDRFIPLHNHSQQREDLAAQILGKIQNELTAHHSKLAELIQYYEDYQSRFATQAVNGMNIAQVQSFQKFISQLEIAITEQKKHIYRVTEACDLKRADWKNERQKTQVLDKVMVRYQKQEHIQNKRQEQRSLDELVSNRYWHQKNN